MAMGPLALWWTWVLCQQVQILDSRRLTCSYLCSQFFPKLAEARHSDAFYFSSHSCTRIAKARHADDRISCTIEILSDNAKHCRHELRDFLRDEKLMSWNVYMASNESSSLQCWSVRQDDFCRHYSQFVFKCHDKVYGPHDINALNSGVRRTWSASKMQTSSLAGI